MQKKIKVFGIIIVFMYLFTFPLSSLPWIDSSWIAVLLLVPFFLISDEYRKTVGHMFRQKHTFFVCGMIALVCFYSAVDTLLLGAGDYSFIKTMVHQALSLFFGLFVIAFLKIKGMNILETVVYAFVIQGVIQVLSMFIEPFREATNVFRPQTAIIMGQWKYSGIRGLAVSSNVFFALAVSYGLVFVLWALYRDFVFVSVPRYKKVIMLMILAFGGFSAGRTSFIGLALGGCIYFVKDKRYKRYITTRRIISYVAAAVSLVVVLVVLQKSGVFQSDQAKHLSNYVLEIVNTGTTTSSDELFNQMYFKMDFETFLIGRGYYSGENGMYYMNTDAGFMRNILYFGMLGFLLLLALQILYFYMGNGSKRINRWIILGFLLIMHIKGEVIGFLIIVEAILLLLYYFEKEQSQIVKVF